MQKKLRKHVKLRHNVIYVTQLDDLKVHADYIRDDRENYSFQCLFRFKT